MSGFRENERNVTLDYQGWSKIPKFIRLEKSNEWKNEKDLTKLKYFIFPFEECDNEWNRGKKVSLEMATRHIGVTIDKL
jgi:hypothetical protein